MSRERNRDRVERERVTEKGVACFGGSECGALRRRQGQSPTRACCCPPLTTVHAGTSCSPPGSQDLAPSRVTTARRQRCISSRHIWVRLHRGPPSFQPSREHATGTRVAPVPPSLATLPGLARRRRGSTRDTGRVCCRLPAAARKKGQGALRPRRSTAPPTLATVRAQKLPGCGRGGGGSFCGLARLGGMRVSFW